jgi:hypothetical protein
MLQSLCSSRLNIAGWWLTYPSEKYESQLFTLFPIYGKKMKKHVPNHQPEYIVDDTWVISHDSW